MTLMQTQYPVTFRVLARIPKSRDLETHVRIVEVDGHISVAISDYVISLETYGRSYWLGTDPNRLALLIQALGQINENSTV